MRASRRLPVGNLSARNPAHDSGVAGANAHDAASASGAKGYREGRAPDPKDIATV